MRVELTEEPPELWIGRVGFDLDAFGFRRGRWSLTIYPHPSVWRERGRGYVPRRGFWPIFHFWHLGPVGLARWMVDRKGWPDPASRNAATSGKGCSRRPRPR